MESINLILDRINSIGFDKTVYEIYCEHNAFKLSKITVDEFEDIFFSLFDDDIEDLILNKESLNLLKIEESEDYQERIGIIYDEIIESALSNYTFEQFINEIPEDEWSNIISNCSSSYLSELDEYIFENYRKLRQDRHIVKG